MKSLKLVVAFFAFSRIALAQDIMPAIQHGHFDDVTTIALDEANDLAYTESANKQLITWDLKTGMMVKSTSSEQTPLHAGINKSMAQLGDTVYKISGPLLTMTVNNVVVHSKTAIYYDLEFTMLLVQKNNPFIFVASYDGKIYVYNKHNLKLITHLTEHNSSVLCLAMNKDGTTLYSSGQDRSIVEWDAQELLLKRRFYGHSQRIMSLQFSSDNKWLYFGNEAGQLKAFSFAGYSNELAVHQISNYALNAIQLKPSKKGETLIITSHDNRVYDFDPKTHKKSTLLKYHRFSLRQSKLFIFERILNRYTHQAIEQFYTDYNATSNALACVVNESLNIKRRKIVVKDFDQLGRVTIRSDYDRFRGICIVNDSLLVVHRDDSAYNISAHQDAEVTLWKVKNGKLSKFNTNHSGVLAVAAYKERYVFIAKASGLMMWDLLENKEQLIAEALYFELKVIDQFLFGIVGNVVQPYAIDSQGKLTPLTQLNGHSYPVNDVAVNQQLQIIATASDDASIRFYNFKGKHIGTLIPIGLKDFILLSDNNDYQITKNAYRKFGFAKGNRFIFPDQFDLLFNKPHKALGALSIGTKEDLFNFENAYLKRVKRMGFEGISLKEFDKLPEIEIVQYRLEGDTLLRLSLKANDAEYPINRINVYVNDVAVFGSKGYSIHNKAKSWEGELSVPFLNGLNVIEVSIFNENGVESLRKSLRYEATKMSAKPNLYIIAFGASNYKDAKYNLTYPQKDAADLLNVFQTNKGGRYNTVKTLLIKNENLTKSALLDGRKMLAEAQPNDIVLLFYAGHGVLDKNFDYYLSTYDIDFMNPAEKGIAYEELESLLDGIKPLRKALFIDACHSGELDKDDVVEITAEGAVEEGDVKFRAVGTTVKEKALGVNKTNALVRELFTDLRKGTGATVISSAGGMEFAQESGQWNNGLFTYCMLEGMQTKTADLNKDGVIMLSELQNYVSMRVTKLSKGLQQPTSRIENDALDWVIW
jgi:WD40 repeat protein